MISSTSRTKDRFWRRTDVRILASFVAIAVLGFVFARLASEVMEGDTLAIDRIIIVGLRSPAEPAVPIGPRWLNTAMIDITAFGGFTALTILTVMVAGYLLVSRRGSTAFFLVGAIVGGAVANNLLKLMFDRPRPDLVPHLIDVHSASFPSGHATNSAVVYLTLGALLARAEVNLRVRVYVLAIAILLTLTIGFSRVYLGVHWPTDVIAGWIFGGAWATTCSMLARRLQRRSQIEPPGSKA